MSRRPDPYPADHEGTDMGSPWPIVLIFVAAAVFCTVFILIEHL